MRYLSSGVRLCVATLAFSAVAVAQRPEASLDPLYKSHRWFELRDAIAGREVPPKYSGAVASAFNQTRDAERLLSRAIREASSTTDANQVREMLASLYMRLSRSADMLRVLDDILSADPNNAEARNVREGFKAFRRVPNQIARLGRRSFSCTVDDQGIVLPARVNGQPVEWLFDSGFSQSAVAESDARRLGITGSGAHMTAGDFTATSDTRIALADRIVIGDSELRHVPVLVFPDEHPIWGDHPPGKRGIVGLPIAVALEGIRWNRTGQCQFGSTAGSREASAATLAFDADTPPVTLVNYGNARLELTLDTGAQGGTRFWRRFVDDFPEVVAGGNRSTIAVRQIGGERQQDIVVVSGMKLRIGGLDVVLPQARVFPGVDNGGFHHGNVGMDLFSQASTVVLDFKGMSLAFR
jgi:hypothetical protein